MTKKGGLAPSLFPPAVVASAQGCACHARTPPIVWQSVRGDRPGPAHFEVDMAVEDASAPAKPFREVTLSPIPGRVSRRNSGAACPLLTLPCERAPAPAAVPKRDKSRSRDARECAMKHAASRALTAYWNERRGKRAAPDRADIEPGAIRRILGDTFILAFDPHQGHPYRLAGTRVCALFGRELKSEPFLGAWSGEDREAMATLVATAARESNGVVASVAGTTSEDWNVELELHVPVLGGRAGDARDDTIRLPRRGRHQRRHGLAVLAAPGAEERLALELAAEQRTDPRPGEPIGVPLVRVEGEDEGVAEDPANRTRLDVRAIGRGALAASLVPVGRQRAARGVFHGALPRVAAAALVPLRDGGRGRCAFARESEQGACRAAVPARHAAGDRA